MPTQTPRIIGILGGTFDPIHNGHLCLARAAYEQCHLDQVRFVPLYSPAHREQPKASAEDRMAMVQLAISNIPHFVADPVELQRGGVSYMVDTIKQLHEQFPQDHLALILGLDAYLTFESWDHWQVIRQHAHLIVCNRPGYQLPDSLNTTIEHLRSQRAGEAILVNMPDVPIQATDIRAALNNTQPINTLVPSSVADYIQQHQLYQD